MSHYQKPAELYDGLRLHQNENTGGCSPRVIEALRALRAGSDRLLPAVRRGDRRVRRAISASPPIASRWSTASTKASWRWRSPTCGRRPAASCPKRSCRSRRSRSSAFDTEVVGGRLGAGDAAARFQLSARRGARGDHAEHARRVPDQPEQPDRRRRCRSRRSAPSRGACRPRRSCSSTRRTPSSPATTLHPRAAGVSQRHRRPDVLEGVRPGRPAHRLPGRRAATRSIRSARAVPVYSVNIAAVVAVQAALEDLDYLQRLPAAGRRIEGAALRRVRSARPDVLEERRELRAGPRRRSHRRRSCRAPPSAASTCAIARPSRAAPAASASAPASSSTRAAASR